MLSIPWLGLFCLLLGNFIPGYLLTILWDADWMHDLAFSERLYIQLLIGVVFNSWLLLFLAELESFGLPAILLSWVLVCGSLMWIGRHHLQVPSLRQLWLSWKTVELIALLLLACILFAHPAESLLVFDDAAIYFLGGVQLAKTGSLFVRDPILASLSQEQGVQVLFTGPLGTGWSRYWGQFFIWDWIRPWVIFGLLHLQRLWCGLFTLFLGVYGGLWVAPVFGLLAVVGIYFLGRRLFTREIGLLAAVLLTLNFVQIWLARLPLSEMLTQALFIGGFYLFTLWMQRRGMWLGIWAGLCLGSLFLARLDALVVEALLFGLVCYWRWSERWHIEHMGFALAFLVALAYATLHNVVFCWAYLKLQWQITGSPMLAKAIILAGLGGGMVILTALLKPRAMQIFMDWLWIHAWKILAVAWSAWVLWLGLSLIFSKGDRGIRIIIWLTQYWTPLGILLAIMGLVFLLIRRPARRVLPVFIVGLAYLGVFSLNPMVNPVQPWAMRRFAPAVMPAVALLTAYALATLPIRRLLLQRTIQVLTVSVLIYAFLRSDRPLLMYTEYEGVSQQIAQLADGFEKDALILFDKGAPSLYVTQSLAYLHGLNSFVLQDVSPNPNLVGPLIKAWQQSSYPVYLVLTGDSLDWHPNEWTFQPSRVFDLQFVRIERSIARLPSAMEDLSFSLDIYQIIPSAGNPLGSEAIYMLNMEAGEYPYLRGGFYGCETATDGMTYRWTNGSACIQVPGRDQDGNGASLRLRVAGGRPAEEASIFVGVNGAMVAKEQLSAGFVFHTLEITVPSFVLDGNPQGATIEIKSNIWIPDAAGYQGDTRQLGVLVDWVEWRW